MKSVLILGIGEFGSTMAKKMNELRCDVLAIDSDEDRVNDILPYVTSARIGDCTNREMLQSLGVNNFDVCIVAVGGLFQTSLEATCTLKELGASFVLARATNDVQMKFLKMAGADEVVYPERQTAIRFATKYASDTILDFIELDNNFSIYEMKVPKHWYGKTVVQIDIRKKYNINIITIKRGDEMLLPTVETKFTTGDVAFVIGSIKDIFRCFKV